MYLLYVEYVPSTRGGAEVRHAFSSAIDWEEWDVEPECTAFLYRALCTLHMEAWTKEASIALGLYRYFNISPMGPVSNAWLGTICIELVSYIFHHPTRKGDEIPAYVGGFEGSRTFTRAGAVAIQHSADAQLHHPPPPPPPT